MSADVADNGRGVADGHPSAIGEASRVVRIVVPWDVSKTAENKTRRGGHWSQRARIMRQAREAAYFAWLQAVKPVAPGKVRVSVTTRRARVMDVCNIVGGLKPVLDGIFVKAMTPDDGPKWLELGAVTQVSAKQWKGREEVELLIEAAV